MPRESENNREQTGQLLLSASARGNLRVLTRLVAEQAEINYQNERGETPLSYAAAWNRPICVRYLLAKGANPNLADKTGGTPLMLAAQHGGAGMVRDLLRYGADRNARDNEGKTVIAHVDWNSRAESVLQTMRDVVRNYRGKRRG